MAGRYERVIGQLLHNCANCRCHCIDKGDYCTTDSSESRITSSRSIERACTRCLHKRQHVVCIYTACIHVACRSCLHRLIRFAIVLVRANSRFVDFKFSSLRFLTAKSQEARESKRTLRSLHLHLPSWQATLQARRTGISTLSSRLSRSQRTAADLRTSAYVRWPALRQSLQFHGSQES